MTEKTYELDKRNARTHPERNRNAIAKSLRELGAGASIVVDKDGVIISGNAVYEQAMELGLKVEEVHTQGDKLVIVVRDDLSTDDAKRKKLAIGDNRIGELSEFDYPVLSELLTELVAVGVDDFTMMGFEDFEIQPLLEGEFTPPKIEPINKVNENKPQTVTCPECGHEFEL